MVGTYSADATRTLVIHSVSELTFKFKLSVGVASGDLECAEGNVECLTIAGQAQKNGEQYEYFDPDDADSQLAFILRGDSVEITSSQGVLGSGSGNAPQLLRLAAVYAPFIAPAAQPVEDTNLFFQSPSGNIGCVIWTVENGTLRCDMKELNPSYTERPDDCPVDWGSAFEIKAAGMVGEVICHGDTVFNFEALTLDYGKTLQFGSFSCGSEKTGLTCTNANGHGFSLSKAKQKVF